MKRISRRNFVVKIMILFGSIFLGKKIINDKLNEKIKANRYKEAMFYKTY